MSPLKKPEKVSEPRLVTMELQVLTDLSLRELKDRMRIERALKISFGFGISVPFDPKVESSK